MQNINVNKDNIKILNRIRLIAIIGQATLILFATIYLDILLPLTTLFSLLTFEIVFQLLSWHRAKTAITIHSKEIIFHIVFDSLILALMVYFTGGANNPFIYLLLLPIALGTIMLTPKSLIAVAVLQLALYSLLNIYQRPLELGESSPLASFHLHLMGMWVNFALTVVLIATFGFLARQSMLKKEKQIQQLRENQLKDEQVLSLGIMSASAAHELGTPLSTVSIIIDDLRYENVPDNMKKDFNLISQQIESCRNILQALHNKSSVIRNQLTTHNESFTANNNLKLIQQLKTVLEHWLVYRPQVILEQDWSNQVAKLEFTLPISVEQAVINLLDNAADASIENKNDRVKIIFSTDDNELIIEIFDYGCGISQEQQTTLGSRIQETSKQDGLGWGMFLSNASIERVGGSVHLLDYPQGGMITCIKIPIKVLQ